MSTVKIEDLPRVESLLDTDVLPVDTEDGTRKLGYDSLKDNLTTDLQLGNVSQLTYEVISTF